MNGPKSGELFAGVGGLGMAVDDVFGSDPAWFCEFDAAPSRVLAHHFPDVPNYGDVTKVDWATAPYVDILAGGFPCQDVSLAGARRGMKDGTRSGLWSEYVKAIDTLRPDWVVIENVRGLISARADSEVEPCPWCVGDGDDEYHLRALDAVLADLSRLGFDAEWTGLRAADVGAPHGRFRFFILAWPRERTLPDAPGVGWREGRPESARDAGRLDDELGGADAALILLPTPTGNPFEGEPDAFMARRARLKAQGINGNGAGTPLAIAVQLLPTPTVTNQHTNEYNGRGELLLPGIVQLLPTPGAYDGERGGSQHPDKRREGGHSVTLQDVAEHALLPTPTARLGQSRGASSPERRKELNSKRSGELDEIAVHSLMPTPRASRGGSATVTMYGLGAERDNEGDRQGNVTGEVSSWGAYAAAIARWESVMGRPAPSAVRMDGKGGKARLNPELTEWMMGWPAGWVTASAQLSRAEQLKACGNGVVPQQAAAALRMLLARPGVPAVRSAVAA